MSMPPVNEEHVFAAAIEIDDRIQRGEYLDQACGDDVRLRASVEELLRMHDTAGDFLDTPALGSVAKQSDEQAGTTIGRYRLVERIGEGGFGVVWKAEQTEPVRREVALKVIRGGIDSQQIIARFEAERQTLAMMRHVNIATVLDAGTTSSGRPYFVMELVEGRSIDELCRQERLSLSKQLELFTEACRAVQHAHQKGIVHRDLKPSNILVAMDHDGRPVLKIIDFGIAKAMYGNEIGGVIGAAAEHGAPLSPATYNGPVPPPNEPVTDAHQLVGTPDYMSPEQTTRDLDIDTRADVYSLGGVLYKLLVGVAPLDTAAARRAGLDELARVICCDEPLAPSGRLARLRAGDPPLRQPSNLRPGDLKGDLDWIVMKALKKKRERRYQSAAEMAADIERHLASQPVSAAPPSAAYRARKFLHRNRVFLSAALLGTIALIVGSCFAALGLMRAERERANAKQQEMIAQLQRQIAEQERQVADQQRLLAIAADARATSMTDMVEDFVLEEAHPRNDYRMDEEDYQRLDEFAESLKDVLKDHPVALAELHRRVGRIYLSLLDLKAAGPQLQRALELRCQHLPADHEQVLQSRADQALLLVRLRRREEAQRQVDALLPVLRARGPSTKLIELLGAAQTLCLLRGDLDKRETLAREGWQMSRQHWGEEHPNTLLLQGQMGLVAMEHKRYEEAERLIRDALARFESLRPDKRFDISYLKDRLAGVLAERNQLSEARELYEEVIATRIDQLGEKSREVVTLRCNVAEILNREGKRAEAETQAREAMATADRVFADDLQLRAWCRRRMAEIVELDSPNQAADLRARGIELSREANHDELEIERRFRKLATDLCRLRRWKDAASCLDGAIAILRKHPDKSRTLALTLHQLADVKRLLGEQQGVTAALREVLPLHDPSSFYTTIARIDYLESLFEAGELEEARRTADAWESLAENNDEPELEAAVRVARALWLLEEGDLQAAVNTMKSVRGELGKALHARSRARVFGVRAHCRIKCGYLKLAETTLLWHEKNRSDPLDRRRIARQLVSLYQAKQEPEEVSRCQGLMDEEFILDPDWDDLERRLAGDEAHRALDEMSFHAYRLQSLGQYENALALAQRVYEHRRQLFGDLHPKTFGSTKRVAFIFKVMRRLDEAEEWFERARDEIRSISGADAAETFEMESQIGIVLRHQGRYEEAKAVFENVLEKRLRVFGECEDSAGSLRSLGELCYRMEHYDEAVSYYRRRIEMLQRIFESDDPRIVAAEERCEHIRGKGEAAQE